MDFFLLLFIFSYFLIWILFKLKKYEQFMRVIINLQ